MNLISDDLGHSKSLNLQNLIAEVSAILKFATVHHLQLCPSLPSTTRTSTVKYRLLGGLAQLVNKQTLEFYVIKDCDEG